MLSSGRHVVSVLQSGRSDPAYEDMKQMVKDFRCSQFCVLQ